MSERSESKLFLSAPAERMTEYETVFLHAPDLGVDFPREVTVLDGGLVRIAKA